MESIVNLSSRSITVFHSLPAVDPGTLPISKMELFMTIDNDFQPLIILVKISIFSVRLGSKYPSFLMVIIYMALVFSMFQSVVPDYSFKEIFIFQIHFF